MMTGDPFSYYEHWIIRIGIFAMFVVTFGDYVLSKIKPIILHWFQ